MYDIRPLEEEWKRYRKKKLRPWYIAGAIIFVLLLAGIFFVDSANVNSNSIGEFLKSVKKSFSFNDDKSQNVPQVKSDIVSNGSLMRLEVQEKPDDGVHIITVENNSENILVDIPILDGKEEERSSALGKVKRKKVHLNIIKTTNVTAYRDVEKRFSQSHDIDDSLFLARSYYKKGNYKKAEYWALETNKVNPNIEESMLIFIKSKIKQGRKNEAKNILDKYIKKSNSLEAKKILYRIENGKF